MTSPLALLFLILCSSLVVNATDTREAIIDCVRQAAHESGNPAIRGVACLRQQLCTDGGGIITDTDDQIAAKVNSCTRHLDRGHFDGFATCFRVKLC